MKGTPLVKKCMLFVEVGGGDLHSMLIRCVIWLNGEYPSGSHTTPGTTCLLAMNREYETDLV
jgi:hypothetical protein